MDEDLQFGDLQEAAPRRALRPDENRHYAVAPYGEPQPGDLPIYVDLDVLAEMEDHATSDMSVELGGVLLGGAYEDEHGRPFVIITDSLRAAHFESTKGSFKFTHDTWSAITREREQFPPELQMVGWYHTHPDWGVFLSGMDMFICDNFFNKQLDVAYVIDPCRGDRGMFQWTAAAGKANERQRVRRTGGFYVTASRFRAAELEYYVAEISQSMPATSTSRFSATGQSPAVVHLHQPRESAAWQPAVILGAFALQFLLVAVLAWKLMVPAEPVAKAEKDRLVAALDKLDASLKSIESRRSAELAEERIRAKSEFLDSAFRELKGTEPGTISRLEAKFEQANKLADDIAARDALLRETRGIVEETRGKIQTVETAARREEQSLKTQITELTTENNRLRADLVKKKDDLASLQAKLGTASGDRPAGNFWWWVGGSVLAAAVIGAGIWWASSRNQPVASESTAEKPLSESPT